MTIEEHNKALSRPYEGSINESNITKINVNHAKVAEIMRYWEVHGAPSDAQLKKQLKETGKYCRTVFFNEIIKLGRSGK